MCSIYHYCRDWMSFGAHSFCLLSKNVKIKICRTVFLPVVWYRCEAWSLIFREEHRLREFENKS
jgi:hypothetical protein